MPLNQNYSFYAVIPAWFLSVGPLWYGVNLSFKSKDLPTYDNHAPREYVEAVRAIEPQTEDTRTFLRATGAQQNGYETLPFFCATLVAGNMAGLPARTMHYYAGFYLTSRLVYNWAYIALANPKWGVLRSWVYNAGIISSWVIWVKASKLLRN